MAATQLNRLMPDTRRHIIGFAAAAFVAAELALAPPAKGEGASRPVGPASPGTPTPAAPAPLKVDPHLGALGYLPSIGPSPLRFQAPVVHPTNIVASAIPAVTPSTSTDGFKASPMMPDENDVLQRFNLFMPAPADEFEATAAPAPQAAAAVVPTTEAQPAAQPTPDSAVSPQMILKYFSQSTNGTATSVYAPVGFTPPHAETPPSSTATYTVGPPR